MSRLIDADRFLAQIEDQYMEHDITREKYMDLEDRIMQQPTIEPERKTGKWIEITPEEGHDIYTVKCDQCGRYDFFETNYCGNCGAKMGEGEEE